MKSILIVVFTIAAAMLSIIFLSPWPFALGTLAAWVTTGSFCLQVLHIIKNKDTTGISLGMYAALFFGVSCWTFYGFKMHDVPVMSANGITALLAFAVIVLKLYHEKALVIKLPGKKNKAPRPQIRSLNWSHNATPPAMIKRHGLEDKLS
ncbi:MtN3 and saliva related transmembrane protein [Gibbsiella quercinecans]|uniref:SemiSWEET family sugar transporter n=1 Tax=Gibbsiella quercinecans TaxID=929813 RepID=UPI000BAF15AD|nr:SemiSWEET family transporter [Gibbsiella quercinecans]TCT88223.1 MtN3 and saliva related transmembrane protein [Gibbsiella quercinecans]